ncbi:MAG: hypothetical protein ACPF9D_12630, partial [Owenweeksia sp.]
MIRLIPFVIFTLFTVSAIGQYSETIRSGRPCQSISSFTVGKNVLQLQQGIDLAQVGVSDDDTDLYDINSWTSNNVIRFGLGRKFEINAVLDYTFFSVKPARDAVIVGETKDDRFTAFDFGARYNILEGLNGGPAWCIQV